MHVILGSGGAIGQPLATALAGYTDHVRCVSRTAHPLPTSVKTRYEHYAADLLDPAAVARALEGADVAYLTAGLPYRTAVWRRDWPALIDNVLAACAAGGVRLAFFDNVYAYADSAFAHLTEEAPLAPTSAKGSVRAEVRRRLLGAHAEGRVRVTVAVAADFYGPGIDNAVLNEVVVARLAAGKSAQWLGDPDAPHSFTYTPDAAAHLALLADDDRAYGHTWHLPTDSSYPSAREATALAADGLGVAPRLTTLPRWLWRGLALVNADLRELYDVRAHVLAPYRLDSSKFECTFGVAPTPFAEGLREVCAVARA